MHRLFIVGVVCVQYNRGYVPRRLSDGISASLGKTQTSGIIHTHRSCPKFSICYYKYARKICSMNKTPSLMIPLAFTMPASSQPPAAFRRLLAFISLLWFTAFVSAKYIHMLARKQMSGKSSHLCALCLNTCRNKEYLTLHFSRKIEAATIFLQNDP